jgi:hypothetical protein
MFLSMVRQTMAEAVVVAAVVVVVINIHVTHSVFCYHFS